MMVNQIVHSRALPFQPKLPTEDEFVAQAIADAEDDIKAGRVHGPFNSAEELIADLEKE